MVFGWRITERYGTGNRPIRLAGLDPAASYRDDRNGTVHSSAALLAHGVDLALPPGDHAGVLIRPARVQVARLPVARGAQETATTAGAR